MPREDNVLAKLASRVRELRGGMTQKEFADMLGVSPQAVSEWEKGNKMPRIGVIEKLSEKYGVTKSYIMGEDVSVTEKAAGRGTLHPKSNPIIDSIERNSAEFNDLTPDEVAEIAKQMEFMIRYVKDKRPK